MVSWRKDDGEWPETAGVLSHRAQRLVTRWLTPCVKFLFRPRSVGWENLPSEGPFMLVTNHAAGIGLAELLSLLSLWNEKYGGAKPLAGFAHPLGFHLSGFREFHREVGSIPSTYSAGVRALKSDISIVVFPGGDHESLKPVWQNNKVDWNGRQGFLRMAREANVPVVPMGIRNGALTAPILWRSHWMARFFVLPKALGFKRFGISLLGILGAIGMITSLPEYPFVAGFLAWAWLGSPLSYLPIFPASLTFSVGAPLEPDVLFGEKGEHSLDDALKTVEGAVQGLVLAGAESKRLAVSSKSDLRTTL